VRQADTLKVKHVIPFASFVWFCHEENYYMNSAMRPVAEAAAWIEAQTDAQPVVLYPGDCWRIGTARASGAAIRRYAADLASLPMRPRHRSSSIEIASLAAAAERFSHRVIGKRSALRVRLSAVKLNAAYQLRRHSHRPLWGRMHALLEIALLRIRPARIWLTDHQQSVKYCLLRNLEPASYRREDCDLEISSEALLFAFRFLWGGETLLVNGRFREIAENGRLHLFDHFGVACALNKNVDATARPI